MWGLGKGAVTKGAVTKGAVTKGTVTKGAVTKGAVTKGAVTNPRWCYQLHHVPFAIVCSTEQPKSHRNRYQIYIMNACRLQHSTTQVTYGTAQPKSHRYGTHVHGPGQGQGMITKGHVHGAGQRQGGGLRTSVSNHVHQIGLN